MRAQLLDESVRLFLFHCPSHLAVGDAWAQFAALSRPAPISIKFKQRASTVFLVA
jgi:hypothetical protein